MITPNQSSEQAVFSKLHLMLILCLAGTTAHCISAVLFKAVSIKARDKGFPSQNKKHLVQDAGLHQFSRHCNPRSPLKIYRQLLNSENTNVQPSPGEKNTSV